MPLTPLWAVAAVGMTAALLVVFVRQLRRTSSGPGPLIAAAAVVVAVLLGVLVVVLTRA